MNYQKIYDSLMEKGKQRITEQYTESHHIIPACMGGSDRKYNRVELLPEEHYIAHLLLVKIYPSNQKLWYAANMMLNRNNKVYGWVKRKFAQIHSSNMSGRIMSEEARTRMSNSNRGRPKSEDHKKNIGEGNKQQLEYLGKIYNGYNELYNSTGISSHLYQKYYLNGLDPVPYINNNTYGMIKRNIEKPSRAATGMTWYNNGVEEKYFVKGEQPEGWSLGRHFNNGSLPGRIVSIETREKLRKSGINRKKHECEICGVIMDAGNLSKHKKRKHLCAE